MSRYRFCQVFILLSCHLTWNISVFVLLFIDPCYLLHSNHLYIHNAEHDWTSQPTRISRLGIISDNTTRHLVDYRYTIYNWMVIRIAWIAI